MKTWTSPRIDILSVHKTTDIKTHELYYCNLHTSLNAVHNSDELETYKKNHIYPACNFRWIDNATCLHNSSDSDVPLS